MNITEHEGISKLSLNITADDAIKISKILSQAPEERLPMILSALGKAQIYIDGLEELEEWKAIKDQAYLIDIDEFMEAIKEKFKDNATSDRLNIPVKDFSDFCRQYRLKPILVKRALTRYGFLIPNKDDIGKLEYTQTVWLDGKAVRCVVLAKEPIGK